MLINKDLYQKCNSDLKVGDIYISETEISGGMFMMDTKEILYKVKVLSTAKVSGNKKIRSHSEYRRYSAMLMDSTSSRLIDDSEDASKYSQKAEVETVTDGKNNEQKQKFTIYRNKQTGYWYGQRSSGSLLEKKPVVKVGWDKVCLEEGKKKMILDVLSQIKHNDLIFNKWGFNSTIEKGKALTFLFYGRPGTGKTLMAQAIADLLDFDLLTITPTDLNDKYFGETEKRIREVFRKADSQTVILFDECDGLIMDRNKGSNTAVAHINQFIYDIEHFDGVCVFTTNNIDFLDKALERRLALKIEFQEPDEITRKEIWRKMIPDKCPLELDVDFDYLAKFPINGGHIKNIVLNAARAAARNNSKKLAMCHFIDAIKFENEGTKGFHQIINNP